MYVKFGLMRHTLSFFFEFVILKYNEIFLQRYTYIYQNNRRNSVRLLPANLVSARCHLHALTNSYKKYKIFFFSVLFLGIRFVLLLLAFGRTETSFAAVVKAANVVF